MKLKDLPKAIYEADFFITKAPCVSYRHITKADFEHIVFDMNAATDKDMSIVMLYISDWDDESFNDDSLSKEANSLFRAVSAKDYAWIRLDGDLGDVFDDLPTFDW